VSQPFPAGSQKVEHHEQGTKVGEKKRRRLLSDKSREQKGIGTNFAVRLPELRRRREELKEKERRKKKKENDKKIGRS
jgi:hypothetical protein